MNDAISSSQPSPENDIGDEIVPIANPNPNISQNELPSHLQVLADDAQHQTSSQNAAQVLADVGQDPNRELSPEEMKMYHAQWEEMWRDGENAATRWGRAAFALLAGWFLAWTQSRAPIAQIGVEWNRWVGISVLCNFVLPALIVWLFFAQGLRAQPWLKDARLNAWNYGFTWKPFARHLKIALILWGLMLLLLVVASRDAGTQGFYRTYFPLVDSPLKWLWLIGTLTIYMACWEWFFRGFLLFGIAQATGPVVAILLQAILFGAMHAGKPIAEMLSSFAGGVILGVICWREKSFVPAFLAHALIHVTWAILVLN